MNLNIHHIEMIRAQVILHGVHDETLRDDLTDHLACMIESADHQDFDRALNEAITRFGVDEFRSVQQTHTYLQTIKKEEIMKRTMFIIGYLAACLTTTGLLFKIMHWPGASILLVLGVGLLNFGFLPIYFYDRYQRAVN